MKKLQITADLEYVSGNLRHGHLEMELSGDDIDKWNSSSREEKEEWISDAGDLIVDDFNVNDRGSIEDISEDLIES